MGEKIRVDFRNRGSTRTNSLKMSNDFDDNNDVDFDDNTDLKGNHDGNLNGDFRWRFR